MEQFRERSESVAAEVRILAQEGKIAKDAKIYRSHPGRRTKWQNQSHKRDLWISA